MIEKQFMGENNINDCKISYYLIKKYDTYGIEIVEEKNNKIKADFQLISQVKEIAKSFAQKVVDNCVTIITLSEIIDDYFSI